MNRQPDPGPPDYLIIGHITRDLVGSGFRLGGTAAYSAVLAKRLGARVSLFTAGAADLPLDILEGVQILNQPGPGTTTFQNRYTPGGRVQTLKDRAPDLELDLIPAGWRKARVVHLAPVAREVPLGAGDLFPESSLGYSLQGWLRDWDEDGRVSPAPLPQEDLPPRQGLAGFLSIEDLGFDRSRLEELRRGFPLLVLTLGDRGAELHQGGEVVQVDTTPVPELDPTGAGDVFAGAFLTAWALRGKSPLAAARLANSLAGASVTGKGLEGLPSEQEIHSLEKVNH